MEADFSGWATKAGLVCSDGLTIMPDAFKHQDKIKVPLVWQHGHKDVENVLGHAVLQWREGEGVWCDAYFNDTSKAKHALAIVRHGDINRLSIWANDLVLKSKKVLHGAIREVSLVLAGANPGASIDPVTIRHGDGELEELEDEFIIYTGLTFEKVAHSAVKDDKKDEPKESPKLKDLVADMTDNQKELVHKMLSSISHEDGESDQTAQEVYDSLTDVQKDLLHYMLGEALDDEADDDDDNAEKTDLKQDNLDADDDDDTNVDDEDTDQKGPDQMGGIAHNVFEAKDKDGKPVTKTLSHDDMKGIMKDTMKMGRLSDAVEAYALAHGIDDIEVLFPEARNVQDMPELVSRRTEWVGDFLGKVKKVPFARIRTLSADITMQEARAKGYIKGTLKKEEFFKVKGRKTGPTTVYKKQKLDRDDIIDITDFDVVVWMKAEMRLMLDEEVARAGLVGDGRQGDDEDKVDEESIRPIASDHELYTTTVTVNISDANSSIQEALDEIALNREFLRGTGLPTMYTTERYIARMLLLRDTTGRKLYRSLEELKTEVRVADIVNVEVLGDYPDIFCILVNPIDYSMGTDRGGQVAFFDDFDIDYNQYKYLSETRLSGALTKIKSAMVVRVTDADAVLVAPAAPTFDGDEITINDTAGVVYRRSDTDAIVTSAAPVAVADGVTVEIIAEPAEGFYFANSNDDSWEFTGGVV